jgi:membrane-associated phospholipid phosphatase
MENLSYTMLITAAGGTLIYGLYANDVPARRGPLTGLEAAGLGVGFNELLERATGSLRPYQTRSSSAFFAGGRSFTSGDIVIESALATGTSAYCQDEWYVAIPLYSLVLLEGFTLIGNNSQWFSDVIGGGLLGWTTAKALLWLHQRQALFSQPGGQSFGIHASNNGRVMIFAGGIPFKRGGQIVGAIGISGGSWRAGSNRRRSRRSGFRMKCK